jgi:hypothetical protein
VALVLAGCSGTVVPAEPADLTFEIAFAVVTEIGEPARERPVSVSGPFPIANGDVTEGSPIHVEAHLDRQSVLLIGLDRVSIQRAVPGFDRARAPRLAIASPPVDPVEDEAARETRLELPLAAQVHRLAGGRFEPEPDERVLDHLTLIVPYDPEACDPGYEVSLAASVPSAGNRFREDFVDVARLDAERIAGLTRGAMFLFEGGALTSSVVFEPPPPLLFAQALAFAIERTTPLRVHVAFETKDAVEAVGGQILTYELSEGLRFVETATLSPATGYYDIIVDPRGLIAIGTGGRVLIRSSPSTAFSDAERLAVEAEQDAEQLVALDGAIGPHFAASPNRLYVGDVTADPPFDTVASPTETKLSFVDLAASPAALWGVTRPPGVFIRRASESRFSALDLDLDPEFTSCAGGTGELPTEIAAAGAVEGGAILVAACTAFLFVREDGCTSTIRLPGRDVRPLPNDDGAVDTSGGVVTIGGVLGEIWELLPR